MKTARLIDVCQLVMGQSPSSESYNVDGLGLPFYQGNADFGKENPVVRTWCTDPKKLAEPNDILLSVRAPIGAINTALEKCCIGRGLAAIRPKEECVRSNYIKHLLRARKSTLEAMGTGSTFKAVGKKILEDFIIPIYPVSKQEVIERQFEGLLSLIASEEEFIAKLDELVKSRFIEMFGDPVHDAIWPRTSLETICSKLGSGATPRGGKSAYKDSGTPLIRSMNVHNGLFSWKDLAYIDDSQAEKLKGVTLCAGDVLLNITGASVARSCVLPSSLAGGRVNQHVAIVRANQESILPIVLNAIFTSDSYQEYLLMGSKMAGATREAITKQDLLSMTIPIPPIELQHEYASFVQQVDKLKFETQQSIEKLQMLYDSLAQEYFGS